MILPQYSLRKLLAITVGAALICLVLSWGVQGYRWAFGISIGALSILAALLVQGAMFWFVWLFATIAERRNSARAARATQSGRAGVGTVEPQSASSNGRQATDA